MELELNRIDYCFVGTTLRNCMKLLPNVYKQQQQIAVGDQDGVIQVFSIKKHDTQIHFKTLPTDKISAIQLGGIAGTDGTVDKIFVASENKVRGFNRKGKLFLSFDTNMTESIKSMFVIGNELIVCGNHVYNHYRDCKDIGSYLCGDTIVDVVALPIINSNRIMTILACSGRVLRLLEHCRVRQTIELDSVPTVLHVPKGSNGDIFLCGFADGKIVQFKIGQTTSEVREEILVKSIENGSAVTALDTYDMSGDGKYELLVGRRDGTVEVYSLPTVENEIDTEVRKLFSDNYNESISSLQGGCVWSLGYTEVIVCTYTGRIFGLTTQCIKLSLSDNNSNPFQAASTTSFDSKGRISKLKHEIEELEQKVQRERERYQLSTQSMSDGLSAIPILPINDSMVLAKEDASYNLSIEIPAPIEFVVLQCDVPIKLLDVDKSTAVISFSQCDPMSGNHLLVTYRCQIDTNRVDLKFKTVEGQHGTLTAYITPNLQPKVSQVRKYTIRPLSMHMRVHNFDDTRPCNTLSLKGSFSLAEMHNWITYCIPEVPEKMQPIPSSGINDKCFLNFRNVFAGTMLHCEYCKGQADFKTENITTISILKDVITMNATKKRIKLEISTTVNDSSIAYMIKLIEPQLLIDLKTKGEYKLLMALVDLDIRSDDEMKCLINEYQDILRRKDEIIELSRTSQTYLNQIFGLLTDCYIDRHKIKGINVSAKIPQLIDLLNNYNYENLVSFFTSGLSNTVTESWDNNDTVQTNDHLNEIETFY